MNKLRLSVAALALTASLSMPSRADDQDNQQTAYIRTNLVSDVAGLAQRTDPNLVNPWGITYAPTSPFWISDNGSGVATLYNGNDPVGIQGLVVTIPPGQASPGAAGLPTGDVFNLALAQGGFKVSDGTHTAPAAFIFATRDGTIAGWSPAVGGTLPSTVAEIAVDNSKKGASYTGLAIASSVNGTFLFAANFAQGRIDVFDDHFLPVSLAAGAFTDPNLPRGFAPFNVQNLAGRLFVTYAKPTPGMDDDRRGIVDVFNLDGTFAQRFSASEALDQPWGVALAPVDFGQFAGDIIVGNHGNGRIHAFHADSGLLAGTLEDANGKPLTIDGLFGLRFGNGANAGPTHTLFFTAGINRGKDGLFGKIEASPLAPDADD